MKTLLTILFISLCIHSLKAEFNIFRVHNEDPTCNTDSVSHYIALEVDECFVINNEKARFVDSDGYKFYPTDNCNGDSQYSESDLNDCFQLEQDVYAIQIDEGLSFPVTEDLPLARAFYSGDECDYSVLTEDIIVSDTDDVESYLESEKINSCVDDNSDGTSTIKYVHSSGESLYGLNGITYDDIDDSEWVIFGMFGEDDTCGGDPSVYYVFEVGVCLGVGDNGYFTDGTKYELYDNPDCNDDPIVEAADIEQCIDVNGQSLHSTAIVTGLTQPVSEDFPYMIASFTSKGCDMSELDGLPSVWDLETFEDNFDGDQSWVFGTCTVNEDEEDAMYYWWSHESIEDDIDDFLDGDDSDSGIVMLSNIILIAATIIVMIL